MGMYRLSAGYKLKGWKNTPYALVNSERRLVRKISLGTCLFLLSCDGETDMEDTPEAQRLLEQGVIERVDMPQGDANPPTYELIGGYHRRVAQVAITGRCNFRCRHCLAADGNENVGTQLSVQECDRIFDELVDNDIYELWITGGEPLVHPGFREIFQSAVAHGLRITSVFTNAWLVDSDLLDFIEGTGQRPGFVVSFDGIGTHDWMRNCDGAETRTLEAISLLRRRGFPVRVGVNVNSVTAPGVIETCRALVRDYHVTSLRLIYTSPTPRWDAALKGGLDPLSPGDYYDLMIELVRISRMEKWGVDIDVVHMPKIHRAPRNPRTWGLLRNPPAPNPDRRAMTCGRAESVLFIASDGRVLPCSTYEGETTMLGLFTGDDINVLKTPLRQILSESEYAREFEATVADLKDADPACAECRWLSVCRGGCALYALGLKYSDMVNPICIMYREGYATKYLDMLEETEPTGQGAGDMAAEACGRAHEREGDAAGGEGCGLAHEREGDAAGGEGCGLAHEH